jgi:hypothetical protein
VGWRSRRSGPWRVELALRTSAADKDWQGVAAQVAGLGPLVFLPARNPRLTFPHNPLAVFPQAHTAPDAGAAWRIAHTMRPGLVLALGTQSFVADMLLLLGLDQELLDLGRAGIRAPVP